jgi:hypothetical protein
LILKTKLKTIPYISKILEFNHFFFPFKRDLQQPFSRY